MHIFELKEDRHNPQYFDRFVKENKQAILDLENIIERAYTLYREISNIITDTPQQNEIMLKLQEHNYATRLSPDILEEIGKFSKIPVDGRRNHPFCTIGINYNVTKRFDEKPIFRFYGNIKVGDISKIDLFDDSHVYFVKRDGGNVGAVQVDLSALIGVGVDLMDMCPIKRALGKTSYDEDSEMSDNFRFNNKFYNVYNLKAEFNTVLVRLMSSKELQEDYELFKESIVNTLVDKFFRNQIAIYTYMRHLFYDRSIVTNNLETVCKLAFMMKLCYNSANGIDNDDLGESFYKLFRDFEYNLQYRGTYDSIINTANLWISRLIKGDYELKRFTDECIFEYLDILHKSRQAIMVSHRAGRIQHANRIVTGMQLIGAESLNLKDTIMNEFGIKNGYENLMKAPANWSSIGFESAGNDYMVSRAKMLNRLNLKERKIFISCESDLMKIKTDSMNVKTIDGQKLIVNRLISLGKIINIELEDKPSDQLKDMLNLLDSERVKLLEKVSNRSIWKERNTMLYGQLRTMKHWDF